MPEVTGAKNVASGLGPGNDFGVAGVVPNEAGGKAVAGFAAESGGGRSRDAGWTGQSSGPASRRRRGPPRPVYAALDLGTNNCRLLVAEPIAGSFRVVDSFSRIVRLGEGVLSSGRLSDAAMERALGALDVCRRKMAERPPARARLIATEACRTAQNGMDFLSRVRDDVGLDLEIIDRRTEARLAVSGCLSLLDPQAEGAILFDIGGGSTEIVWLDRQRNRRGKGLIRAWVSLPVGVVTLCERHGGVDIDDAAFEAMVADARAEFHRFHARDALKLALRDRHFHFLGTSGTVTTLAGVHLGLARYNRRQIDGLWMENADVERMMAELRRMDYRARVANACIGRERADLVLAGCAVFEAIRREWPLERLRVADRGLREGILVQLMQADGYLRNGPRERAGRPATPA